MKIFVAPSMYCSFFICTLLLSVSRNKRVCIATVLTVQISGILKLKIKCKLGTRVGFPAQAVALQPQLYHLRSLTFKHSYLISL